MPTVRAQRQIHTEALPGVRKTAAETPLSRGAGLALEQGRTAETIGNIAGAVGQFTTEQYGRVVEQERRRANEITQLGNANAIDAWMNAKQYGDGETPGWLQLQGRDALGLPETSRQEYDKFTGDLAKGLGNDEQRRAFADLKAKRGLDLDLTIRRHVATEITQYEGAELKATVDNATSNAIRSAMDPRAVGEQIARATSAIKTHGPRLGMGPEQVAAQVGAVTSQVHTGVIDQLLTDDRVGAARIYFEETKDQIAGDKIAQIQKALDIGKVKDESRKAADVILAGGGTLTEQLEKAKAIADTDVSDATVSRLKQAAVVKEAADRDAEEAMVNDAYATVDRARSLDGLSPTTLAKLGSHLPGLRSFAAARAAGTPIKTDLVKYYSLVTMAGDDPAAFAKENLATLRSKLSESDFESLAGLQLSIKNSARAQKTAADAKAAADAEKKATATIDGFRTNQQIVHDTLTLYGLDPVAKPGTDQGKANAQLSRMLDEKVERFNATVGKRPTNEEIQEMLDSILSVQVGTPGSWWGLLKIPTLGYDPFGVGNFYDTQKPAIGLKIGDVPADMRKRAEEGLRKAGRPVTDETILAMYLNYLTSTKGGG